MKEIGKIKEKRGIFLNFVSASCLISAPPTPQPHSQPPFPPGTKPLRLRFKPRASPTIPVSPKKKKKGKIIIPIFDTLEGGKEHYLEKALQPPDLEDAFGEEHAELEDAPPFDAAVGAFGGVAVDAFPHDDVGLFVFDLGEEVGEEFDWFVFF